MKTREFTDYIESKGCEFKGHGGNHDKYINPRNGKRSVVGRHREIENDECKRICRQLGIPPMR